jgi:hypothetical protein
MVSVINYTAGLYAAVLLSYATFRTLPSAIDASIHILTTHSERADSLIPGEVNLHESMAARMRDEEYKWKRLCSRHIAPNLHLEGANPVHLIIHNGDFVNIDAILQSRVLAMLDVLMRDDSGLDAFDVLLKEAEAAVRTAYRTAFTNPTISEILKRNGNIFLSGQGESASFVSSLLAVIPSPPKPDAGGNRVGDDFEDDLSASLSRSQSATLLSVPAQVNRLVYEYESGEIGAGDPHLAAQEELRMLLMGAVLRLARYKHLLTDEFYHA